MADEQTHDSSLQSSTGVGASQSAASLNGDQIQVTAEVSGNNNSTTTIGGDQVSRDKNVGIFGEDLNNIIKTVQVGAAEAATKAAVAAVERVADIFKEASKESSRGQSIAREDKFTRVDAIVPPDPKKIEDVTRWFRELKNPKRQYFVLLLSMFSGLKWADFSVIYRNWLEVLTQSKKLVVEKTSTSPFDETDDELLNAVCAQLVRKDEDIAEFIQFRDTEEFKDAEYRGAILEMMRRSYRNQLNDLLSYLQQLGTNGYWEVRARASQAVAEIAKGDFYLARQNAFEVWARDDRAYVRAAVGYAAAKLIRDNVAVDQLHHMLRDWTKPESPWKLAWAAASTCKQIGLGNPDVALDDLRRAAGYDDIRVTDSVTYALVVISLEGHLDKVVAALRKWIEGDDQVVSITATLAFLVLASGYIEVALQATKAKVRGESVEEDVKDLLQVLADSNAGLTTAAYLLVRAFEYKLWDQAFDVIAGWARQSADNPALQNTARNVVIEMYRELKPPRPEQTYKRLSQWESGKDKSLAKFAASTKAKIKTVILSDSGLSVKKTDGGKSIVFG